MSANCFSQSKVLTGTFKQNSTVCANRRWPVEVIMAARIVDFILKFEMSKYYYLKYIRNFISKFDFFVQ